MATLFNHANLFRDIPLDARYYHINNGTGYPIKYGSGTRAP